MHATGLEVVVRILVLDDDEPLRKAVADMLRTPERIVDTAGDAVEAIKMVESTEYDFILVDYMMPVNNGIWFMKNVKLTRGKTKVLLMTAYVNSKVIAEMFSLGAVGYVIKPFDYAELMRHLGFHSGQEPQSPSQLPL